MNISIVQTDWQTRRDDLLAIRYAVFVDEQGVPAELEHDEHDHAALHLLAVSPNGSPVATARMLPDGQIGRMAVLPAWRRQGIGSAMLRELIAISARRGGGTLFLHAQCRAEPFYQRLGFVAEGDVFDDAGIDHRRMTMNIDRDAG